jgi:hypothetical protein
MHDVGHILGKLGTCLGLVALVLGLSQTASAQAPGYADIASPIKGEAVQGLLTIEGSASHPFFQRYDLAFAYQNDPTQTWFVISDPIDQPVTNGPLGLWDTSGITDGEYRLRLRVFLSNGNVLQVIVEHLRIRNYTAIEPSRLGTQAPAATPTLNIPTITPRPTPLPALTGDGGRGVLQAFTIGAVLGSLGLMVGGVYLFARRRMQIRLGIMRTRRMLWQRDRQRRKRE